MRHFPEMTHEQARKVLEPQMWVRPDNYVGKNWNGWAVIVGRHRDSDLLSNHNYESIMEVLHCSAIDDDAWQVISVNHWAVGWIESIAVKVDNEYAACMAAQIFQQLQSYPIWDEDGYLQAEEQAVADLWSNLSVTQRKWHLKGLSLTEEQLDELTSIDDYYLFTDRLSPYDDSGHILDRLRSSL